MDRHERHHRVQLVGVSGGPVLLNQKAPRLPAVVGVGGLADQEQSVLVQDLEENVLQLGPGSFGVVPRDCRGEKDLRSLGLSPLQRCWEAAALGVAESLNFRAQGLKVSEARPRKRTGLSSFESRRSNCCLNSKFLRRV